MTILDWDSEFFGVRIARAEVHGDLEQVLGTAREAGIECLYLVVPAAALETVAEAIVRGAVLTDLRLVLEREGAVNVDVPARCAGPGDAAVVEDLAVRLVPYSRFWRDPHFRRDRVEEMYRLWARRCLAEGVVTLTGGDSSGFVGVRVEEGVAKVDLVYVDPESSGRGVARTLIASALEAVDASRAEVGTQLGNIPALRVYEALGFRARSASTILHVWLESPR